MSLGSRYAFYGCSLSVTSKCLIALSLSSCALQDLQVCSSNMLLRALVVSTCAFQVCSACVLFQLIFCVCSISVLCKSAFCMCSLGGCSATCSCGPSSLQKKACPTSLDLEFQTVAGAVREEFIRIRVSPSLSQRKRFLQVE